MNNEKPKDNIGPMIISLIAIGVFVMVILVAVLQKEEDPQAILLAQQKWAKNDLLLNSLQRYTDVYQKLNRTVDKEALALGYVQRIAKDLLMFPAKDGVNIHVVLPAQAKDNTTVIVLKEIRLGTTDNGLFKAFRKVLDPKPLSATNRPPIYLKEVERLLSYVITGGGSEVVVAGTK